MTTMPADDYPAMPALPAAAGTIDGATLAEAVSYVTGAASTDDTLPILGGIETHAENGTLHLRATDRYRLAEASLPWPGDDFKTTIKAKWLTDAVKTIAGETQLLISDEAVGIRSGNRATTTLIIGGDYPKIRALFPDHTPTTVTVNRAELLDVVGRVALVAERNTPVRLDIRDGEITVDAGTGEDAQGRETLPCQLDGDPITAAYNPAYLTWSLNTIPGDTARLGYTTAPKPTLITPGDSESCRHLIMPVRLP
jgi:DNA polymerase-3 subunit beta